MKLKIIFAFVILNYFNSESLFSQEFVPIASTIKIDTSFVKNTSSLQLKLIRNEIFAYHGYIFNTPELNYYFKSSSWYKPKLNNVDNLLTDLEKENIKFIQEYEKTGFIAESSFNSEKFLSNESYFKFGSKGYIRQNVSYDYRDMGKPQYLIQHIDFYDQNIDHYVDGTSINISTLNIFESIDGGFVSYKTIREFVRGITLLRNRSRLIYEINDIPECQGNEIFYLVDVNDNFPFLVYETINQCFNINASGKERWISYYTYASNIWIYDRYNIDYIDIDKIMCQRIGSIVYSDYDNIYQIIDIYKPQNSSDESFPYPSISLASNSDQYRFSEDIAERGYNIINIDQLSGFDIIFNRGEKQYHLPVNGEDIDVSQILDSSDKLYVKKRSIK